VACEARAIDERAVRNSGGGVKRRYIIRTLLKLGDSSWPIELALANRDQMGFRMLLGRTALEGRALIEPGRSYLLGARPAKSWPRRKLPSLRASKLLR
jgi:ribosomal protein S6--L-glutamate ligase